MLSDILEEIKTVLVNLYDMKKVKIDIYGKNKIKLCSYPKYTNKLCDRMQAVDALFMHCKTCISNGIMCSEKYEKPFAFKCYVGSVVIVTPIFDDGENVGYLRLSNIVLDCDKEYFIKNLNEVLKKGEEFYSPAMIADIVQKVDFISGRTLKSVIDIAEKHTHIDRKNKINLMRSIMQAIKIKDYVENHISEQLTVSNICKDLYMSKTGLYTIARDMFGMGISDYVREKRIERGKRFLAETDLSITQIAYETGFSDANYFTRVFKTEVGTSPRAYREDMNLCKKTTDRRIINQISV